MTRATKLKLYSIVIKLSRQRTELVHDDMLNKHFQSIIKVSRGIHDIFPNKFMLTFILIQKI